jgi:hypothetical protein
VQNLLETFLHKKLRFYVNVEFTLVQELLKTKKNVNTPDIERNDSNGVPGDGVEVVALIVEDEGEHAVDKHLGAVFRNVS